MSQKIIAECIGTFALTLAVLLSTLTSESPLATPVLAAATLGLFVYAIGSISGAHLNPAVTIGLWSIKKILLPDALRYIAAQLVGALAAFGLIAVTIGGATFGIVSEDSSVLTAEIVGTALFTFGIAAVVYGKTTDAANGLLIGGSLLLGISVAAGLGSDGILNPAIGLALGSTSLSYVCGSIIGAILGMQLYRQLVR
jgi:glycerol uptake facilitator-like aquaporin